MDIKYRDMSLGKYRAQFIVTYLQKIIKHLFLTFSCNVCLSVCLSVRVIQIKSLSRGRQLILVLYLSISIMTYFACLLHCRTLTPTPR